MRSVRSLFLTWSQVIICLVLAAGTVSAQEFATILGRVTDSSGAVIANAKVSATNIETGQTRSSQTSSTGDYELPLMPITGRYSLLVSNAGFQLQQIEGIVLQVDQKARFDFVLKPGAVTEKVTVQGQASLVNTDSGSIGQVIDNRTVLDLPLNGRNFVSLATLTPGAWTSGSSGNTGFAKITVGGGHAGKTEFLLDGISDQDQLYDGVMFTPSIDALQEFTVQENSFSAEYGRGDAVVNATIKGGTNELHGDLFEFLRNSDLDARNFFNHGAKGQLIQNQFGGTGGGPIRRNRTFFFVSYDGTRHREGQPQNNVVPTQAERTGDLSGLLTTVKDPLTGTPFANNVIPSSRINPSPAYFLQFMPLPNTAQGTYYYNGRFTPDTNQGNIRIDHRFNDADTLFGRYSINDFNQYSPGSLPQNGGVTLAVRVQDSVLSETHTFSPTLLNELRLGYERMYAASAGQGLGTNYTVQSGIQGFNETTANFPGFPALSISGFTGINGNDFVPLVNPENMYEIVNSVTWSKGAHTIKFGLDLRRNIVTSTNAAHSRGDFSFSGTYTGAGLGDFLTGYPVSGARDFPRDIFGQTTNNYHFYVEDDWKVNSRLTLNLGLRYEFNPQPQYLQNQASWFDPLTGQIAVSQYNGKPNLTTQQVAAFAYAQFLPYFVTPQQVGVPNGLLRNHYNDWAPRLGLAFRPFNDNKTVIRAGAGIFYLLQSANNTVSQPIINLPFIVDENKSQPTVNGRPTVQVQNFFQPFSANESFNTPYISTFDPNNRTPLLNQWNLAIQRELPWNLALEVAYVGSKGTHMEEIIPFNVPAVNPNDNRPFQQRLPFPAFSVGSNLENINNSTYNALQIKAEKRYSFGLSFLISYAYGKAIDGTTNDQGGDTVDNPFNLRSMKGPSSFDVPNRLAANYIYELPVGHGKAFLGRAPKAVDAVVGGWRLGGVTEFRSGLPFTPALGPSDPANVNGTYARRPNVIGTGAESNPTLNEWFNINDFAVPQPFTIGNAGRDILRGPDLQNWDFSLSKAFRFTDRKYAEFRSEFFDVFNHPNFGLPNPNIEDKVHGGQITGTTSQVTPRIIQFALKLYF